MAGFMVFLCGISFYVAVQAKLPLPPAASRTYRIAIERDDLVPKPELEALHL